MRNLLDFAPHSGSLESIYSRQMIFLKPLALHFNSWLDKLRTSVTKAVSMVSPTSLAKKLIEDQ